MAARVSFGFRLKEFFSVEEGAFLKIAIVLVALYYLVWDVAGLGIYIRKQLFGTPHIESIYPENVENIEDFEDFGAGNPISMRGYVVYKTFTKKYSISGTFIAKGSNVDFLQYTPIKLLKEEKDAYMDISPSNLTVVWGPNINEALKACDFLQPTNSYVKCPKDYSDENAYINNYHIIPATRAIENGVNALPKHAKKQIYLEGFLIDWDFVKDNKKHSDFRFQSASHSGQMLEHARSEDVKLRKNFQLYLTRLVYDGYEFK